MAAPQLEDGYTKISNELLDALARIRIPGEARQVFDVILRQTYGWNKKEAEISLAEFQNKTGLKKTTVCKAIAKLRFLNIITQKGNTVENKIITQKGNTVENKIITQKGNASLVTYGLQKDFEKWQPLPKKVTLPNWVIKPLKSLPKKVTPILLLSPPLPQILKKKKEIKKDLLSNSPKSLKPNKKIKPGTNLREEIHKSMLQFNGSHALIESFLSVVASQNKTGLIAESKKLSLLCQLGDVLTTTGDKELFREALLEVLERGVGNVNYLRKIINSRLKKIKEREVSDDDRFSFLKGN